MTISQNFNDVIAAYASALDIEQARIVVLKAELAALRPLAALGERALREEWYIDGQSGRWHCCNGSVPMFMADKHSPGCDVPALLAQLEANPDA